MEREWAPYVCRRGCSGRGFELAITEEPLEAVVLSPFSFSSFIDATVVEKSFEFSRGGGGGAFATVIELEGKLPPVGVWERRWV